MTCFLELEVRFEKIKNAQFKDLYQVVDKTPLRMWISIQYPHVQLLSIRSVSSIGKQFCKAFKIGGKIIEITGF